jgi:hypothetical protein
MSSGPNPVRCEPCNAFLRRLPASHLDARQNGSGLPLHLCKQLQNPKALISVCVVCASSEGQVERR